MHYKYFITLLFFFGIHHAANANFVFNPGSAAAYRAIFDLRFNDAKKYIRDEKIKNPQNGIPILLDNYIDYLTLLTSESKIEYEKFKDKRSGRINAINDNDKNSPYYLFAQAEIYLQSGMIKARFGDYLSSMLDFKMAKSLLTDNDKKFKDFLPNQKSLGLIEVIFGAIPSNLKGITGFLGFRGDITNGNKRLEKFRLQIVNSKFSYYNDEVVMLLCFTHIDVSHDRNSYSYLAPLLEGMTDKSALKAYLQGYAAFKTGHTDAAIRYMESVPKASPYYIIPLMNYLYGNAKLCRMDTDAYVYLNKFIIETRSENYIKDTYQKLAYYYLLKNNQPKYNYYLGLVRSKGAVIDEKDKQALKEANDLKPNITLLKARLYFDGGYYNNALAQLRSIQPNDLKPPRDKIELFYRLGRTYDKMNNFDDALENYQRAINMGWKETYYFAANSALNSGLIYQQKNDYKKASYYYHLTLQMKNHEYQNSIDTQAKEGLRRLGEE